MLFYTHAHPQLNYKVVTDAVKKEVTKMAKKVESIKEELEQNQKQVQKSLARLENYENGCKSHLKSECIIYKIALKKS